MKLISHLSALFPRLTTLIVGLAMAPLANAGHWVAGRDLVTNELAGGGRELTNPNASVPEWSYGDRASVASTDLRLFGPTERGSDGTIKAWQSSGSSVVGVNTGNVPAGALGPRPIYPGEMVLHPRIDLWLTVVRWTAPKAGTYAVSAFWQDHSWGMGDGGTAHVVVNGVEVFGYTFDNGNGAADARVITLNAGDKVDFLLGARGGYHADATRFNAFVTTVQDASQLWVAGRDLGSNEKPDGNANETTNPNGTVPQWSYGSRSTIATSALDLFSSGSGHHFDGGVSDAMMEGWKSVDTAVLSNTSNSAYVSNYGFGSNLAINPGELLISPSASGTLPVVRWTAPSTGRYDVLAFWQDLDAHGGNGLSANVVVNGTELFVENMDDGGGCSTVKSLTLTAGDQVDFLMGTRGNFSFDTTKFNVVIVRPALHVTSLSFPFAGGQVEYSGGTGPYTFSVVGGALPAGLSLSPEGVVTGSASNGAYSVTVRVTDSLGATDERVFAGAVELPVIAPAGLAAWWPGQNTVADIIGGDHLAVAPSGSFGYAPGKVGRAFHFDGTSQSIASAVPTDVMKHLPLTIEAWIKPEARTSGNLVSYLPTNVIANDRVNFGGHGFGAHLYPDGSMLRVGLEGATEDFRTVPDVTFTDGTWVHVVVVYTEGNVKTYLDGELQDDYNFEQGELNGGDIIRVGRHNDDTGFGSLRFFKGAIDEPSLYHAELDGTQVQDLYLAGAGGKQRHDAGIDFNAPGAQTLGNRWTYGTINVGSINTSTFAHGLDIVTASNGIVYSSSGGGGVVAVNPTGTAITELGHIVTLPQQVRQHPDHPGNETKPSVMRWKATASGRYAVCGSFTGLDDYGVSTDVHVYHNTLPMIQLNGQAANGIVASEFMGNGHSFTGVIDAQVGDTVDFIVGSNTYSYADSTGTFASLVYLGPALPKATDLRIATTTPLTTERLWTFSAQHTGGFPGLALTVQYAAAADPSTWVDIPVHADTNLMNAPASSGAPWTLAVGALPLPAGNYFFRVSAAADSGMQSFSPAFGREAFGGSDTGAIAIGAPGQPPPPLPLTPMPTPTTLAVLINNAKATRGKQGDSMKFTAQVAASPSFSRSGTVEVEYSSTPADTNSWLPMTELVFAGRASNGILTYTGTQTNLPSTDSIPGGLFFRLKASAPDRISAFGPLNKLKSVAPAGPFFITGTPSWEYVNATLSVPSDPTGDTALKGEEITYSIKFKNNGGVDATDVEASIPVPSGTTLMDYEDADIKSAGARVTWLVPSVPAGSPEVVKSITVKVTANRLGKITPGLFTLKCKQLTSRSAVPLVALGRKGFVTYVVSPFAMTLSGVPESVAPGQLLNLTLKVRNHGTESYIVGLASFMLPAEVLAEDLRSNDGTGNFVDTPFINPGPTTSPSLISNGGRQQVMWDLGAIAPASTREMRLSVRVRYDAKDVATFASGLTSVYKIVFDRYNFTAKSPGKTLSTFSGNGPAHTSLLNGTPASLPPILNLTKKAQADGKLVGAAINAALPGETLFTAGIGEVTTVEQNKRLLYTLQYSNTGPQPAEDVVLYDEIPAGASFQGWLRHNGTLISSEAGITLRDGSSKIVSMQAVAKYPTVRFIEINLGDLPAGTAGEWSYETLATGKVGTFLVSQNRASISKLGSSSRQKVGHFLYSPSFALALPRSAAIQYSLITGPATFDVQPPVIAGSFRPGNSVLVDIPYQINGGDGINLEFRQMKIVLRIPRYYELGSATLPGGGNYNVAHLALDTNTNRYNVPRGTLPGESAPTLSAMDSKGYTYLTFTLRDSTPGALPGGRQGAVRAVLRLPDPVPAALLTTSGHLKEAPRFIADPSGEWRKPPTSPAPVPARLASTKGLPVIPTNFLTMSGNVSLVPIAPLPPKQAEPFIGRIAPVSVTPGQEVTITIFFGNPTPLRPDGDTILTKGELAMAIPPGTTFRRATVLPEILKPGGNGETDDRDRFAYEYELITKDGQQFIVWPEIPFLHPHSAGAAQVTVYVPTTFTQSQIQDTRCYLKFQNGLTVNPGTLLVGVKQSNPLTWLMDAVGSMFQVIGMALEGRALEALQPQINQFNEKSRTTTISGTQFLQLDNGVVVVPLGGVGGVGRCLTFGPKRFIDASTFNVLADDGGTVVVAGMDNTPGMFIKGLATSPQGLGRNVSDQWSPAAAISGLRQSGSSLVAAGAGNLVAAGGGNMVAAGGGNIIDNGTNLPTLAILTPINANMVAAGGGNMVAAGGGNMVAVGSMVAAGGGNMVAAGGGNFFPGQGMMVAAGGGNMVAAGGGNLVGVGAVTIRAADLPAAMGLATRPPNIDIGGFVKNSQIPPATLNGYLKNVDAGKVSAADAAMIGLDSSTLVAAGAGN